jgi:CheY-like chemotaxis protein/two-component sensor histidine kinase
VNQVLDIKQLESGKLSLNLQQSDMVSYLRSIVNDFQYYAVLNNVNLKFVSETDALITDFDGEKLKIVISNLISNAFKYNDKQKGMVTLLLCHDVELNTVNIKVEDNGIGFSQNESKYIFKKYVQIHRTAHIEAQGSGIGLYYSKMIIELMGGEIKVRSKPNKGTCMTIVLPKTNLSPIYTEKQNSLKTTNQKNVQISVDVQNKETEKEYNLLIVDDNPSIRELLRLNLKDLYNLEFEKDGYEGINTAIEKHPDLVVSDIMMPNVDGLELCNTLKTKIDTSHIPIILLTSKTGHPSKMQGLKSKADAYLTKPFEMDELKIIIKNLIEERKKLQYIYRDFYENNTKTELPIEDHFITELRKFVKTHVKEEGFNIEDICHQFQISRSGFHSKLKSLTGLTASEFINKVKMHEAKHLLLNTDLNVTEIAYEYHIYDVAYFSKLFKKEFGLSPTKYLKKVKDSA